MPASPEAKSPGHGRLIEVEETEVEIEHHLEDWLAFAIFWALAAIVFLQFFTRYVLNDSVAWTEEIARYGLIWVAFIGAVMVTRKHSHIAVALLPNVLPAWAARLLLAFVDIFVLGFLALLAYFSVLIIQRMQMQRMTVVELPMSVVYGAVVLGCFLMCLRQLQRVWRNARDGWGAAQRALTEGLVVDDAQPEGARPESAKP
jgi:TRAP-type C4-dicarboxylate transport system permease small subunit